MLLPSDGSVSVDLQALHLPQPGRLDPRRQLTRRPGGTGGHTLALLYLMLSQDFAPTIRKQSSGTS